MLGLPIEEAVGESYEEALEGEEHVPGEDEDGGHGGGGALGAHDREDVGDAQHRHDDDQRLSTNHSSVLPPSDQSQLSIVTLGPITAQYCHPLTNHSSVLSPSDQSQLSIATL